METQERKNYRFKEVEKMIDEKIEEINDNLFFPHYDYIKREEIDIKNLGNFGVVAKHNTIVKRYKDFSDRVNQYVGQAKTKAIKEFADFGVVTSKTYKEIENELNKYIGELKSLINLSHELKNDIIELVEIKTKKTSNIEEIEMEETQSNDINDTETENEKSISEILGNKDNESNDNENEVNDNDDWGDEEEENNDDWRAVNIQTKNANNVQVQKTEQETEQEEQSIKFFEKNNELFVEVDNDTLKSIAIILKENKKMIKKEVLEKILNTSISQKVNKIIVNNKLKLSQHLLNKSIYVM